jgi:hypothetical protein
MYPQRRMVRQALRLGLLVTLFVLALSACGGGGGGGGEQQQANQQAKGRPLPKGEDSVPAGPYHTTVFEPSFSFRITADGWWMEGPSGTHGDPSRPDYLFFHPNSESEIAFFNLRKLKGVYKPGGPKGEIEPVPAPDELVGWFQHHPYLETSKPEPISVGGVKGVQFDVVTVNLQNKDCSVDIFALSTGGPSEVFCLNQEHYIVLKDVKGVPVVIYYNAVKDHFDKFVPVAEKVLQSVEWTGT